MPEAVSYTHLDVYKRQMLHGFSRPGIILYQDDIKSARTIMNPVLRQILRRKLNQFGTFARIHRFNRTTVGPRPSPFHLDEHQHPLVIGNQVEFTQWGSYIPSKDSKPLSAQIGFGSPLSFIPYQSASVAHRSSGPSDWSTEEHNFRASPTQSCCTGAKLRR